MATGDKRPVVMSADRAAAYGIATLGADAKLSDSQIPIQKIMAITNSAEYSSAQTYALGDYCTHDGKLYRCTTAITEAEAWTVAHWTETTVGAELIAIYTALQNKAPANIAAYSNINITVNDGESIQAAVNSIPKDLNGNTARLTIYGTHNETVTVLGFHGGEINLTFSEATLNGTLQLYDDEYVYVAGSGNSTINGGSAYAIHLSSGTSAIVTSINLSTSSSTAVLSGYLSHALLLICQVLASGSENYYGALTSFYNSSIYAEDVTIQSGTPVGMAATGLSTIWFNGTNNANTASVLHHSKIEIF